MTIHLSIESPFDISPGEAALLLAIQLYEDERLTLAQAAGFCGMALRDFMEELGTRNIPVIRYSARELEREAGT